MLQRLLIDTGQCCYPRRVGCDCVCPRSKRKKPLELYQHQTWSTIYEGRLNQLTPSIPGTCAKGQGHKVTKSWNSTGTTPMWTPTPTLGMRLSCNFVNVYTIAYRVSCGPSRGSRVSDKSARILVRVRLVENETTKGQTGSTERTRQQTAG